MQSTAAYCPFQTVLAIVLDRLHADAYTLCYFATERWVLQMRVLSVGEILWDVFTDGERLGGAALNFCANIARLGDEAHLITAVGKDARGDAATAAMASLGLPPNFVQRSEQHATGIAFVSKSAEGEPSFEISRPAAYDAIAISTELLQKVALLEPDWLYFGTLLQSEPRAEAGLIALRQSLPRASCFYDMNLRAGCWSFPLVERLCRLANVLKLNQSEAEILSSRYGIDGDGFTLKDFCERCAQAYQIDAICVTLGSDGCFIYDRRSAERVPGYKVEVRDTVGAGDAFAAAFLHGYHLGWSTMRTARFANAVGAIVASRAGATPSWSTQECLDIIPGDPSSSLKVGMMENQAGRSL